MTTRVPLRAFAAVCAVFGILPLANILTGGAAVRWWNAAVLEWVGRGVLVIGLALVAAVYLGARVDRMGAALKRLVLRPSPAAFAVVTSGLALEAAVFLAHYSFGGEPFTSDEMAQQFQARILLAGHLAAIPEAAREFFNTWPMYDRGGVWFSQYPIGGPAFIALGLRIGAAWLVNPVLLGVATWHLYRFLSIAFDELTARVATLLFVASPMVLITAASQMNHAPALAFTMVAFAALARWDRAAAGGPLYRAAAVIGVSVGVIATVRPLDALVAALVIGGFQLWRIRGAPLHARSLALESIAGAVPIALLLWVNARTTGGALLFGYEALHGPEHGIGFHRDPTGALHTPTHGIVLMSGYVMGLSHYLFEWPVPGMLFIVAGLLAIDRPSRWDVLLAAFAAALLFAYGAYWFEGFLSGPRFLYPALPAFVYFAARFALAAPRAPTPLLRRALVLLVPICLVVTWLGPGGVSNARSRFAMFREQRTKQKTDIGAQVTSAGLSHALVFVNEEWRGRLLARLRSLGISQFRAERALDSLDACVLHDALNAEDTLRAASDAQRIERVLAAARAAGPATRVPGLPPTAVFALIPRTSLPPTCLAEPARDTLGTMPFGLFLARQEVGRDGRIGGDVVFARDLGARNERLRARFGNRTWYRYRPARGLYDTTWAFVPYEPPLTER